MLFLLDLGTAGEIKRTQVFSGRIDLGEAVFVVVNVAAQVDDFDVSVVGRPDRRRRGGRCFRLDGWLAFRHARDTRASQTERRIMLVVLDGFLDLWSSGGL